MFFFLFLELLAYISLFGSFYLMALLKSELVQRRSYTRYKICEQVAGERERYEGACLQDTRYRECMHCSRIEKNAVKPS